jgi:hypothetical protein
VTDRLLKVGADFETPIGSLKGTATMVLTRSAQTATIIAFPGTFAKDIGPDTAALVKRAWQATERLICALPSTMHPEKAKHASDLASFVSVVEQAALAAEHTFKVR